MASPLYRQPLKGFLNLSPVTSDSFPVQPASTTTTSAESAPKTGIARRSSSVSTVNSVAGQQRFLKLGPVHFGEHQDSENKDDWSAISE
jgi:hypothetical protein